MSTMSSNDKIRVFYVLNLYSARFAARQAATVLGRCVQNSVRGVVHLSRNNICRLDCREPLLADLRSDENPDAAT